MLMKRVLIAYGTRFGSTEEVAEEMRKALDGQDCEAHLLNTKETKDSDWPSPKSFDGVLVGSSIKIMRWMKEPKRFLKKNRDILNGEDMPLGVFVSSMGAAFPESRQEILDKCISDVMEELGIKPDIHDAFGGVFDFSSSSRMGFFDKQMAKVAAKGMAEDLEVEIDTDAKNDFRDWNRIRSFAEEFRKLIT
jgi:menaquinone-dependent protoporphyrinogen oxidase